MFLILGCNIIIIKGSTSELYSNLTVQIHKGQCQRMRGKTSVNSLSNEIHCLYNIIRHIYLHGRYDDKLAIRISAVATYACISTELSIM